MTTKTLLKTMTKEVTLIMVSMKKSSSFQTSMTIPIASYPVCFIRMSSVSKLNKLLVDKRKRKAEAKEKPEPPSKDIAAMFSSSVKTRRIKQEVSLSIFTEASVNKKTEV